MNIDKAIYIICSIPEIIGLGGKYRHYTHNLYSNGLFGILFRTAFG